jgi:hypothetical protein
VAVSFGGGVHQTIEDVLGETMLPPSEDLPATHLSLPALDVLSRLCACPRDTVVPVFLHHLPRCGRVLCSVDLLVCWLAARVDVHVHVHVVFSCEPWRSSLWWSVNWCWPCHAMCTWPVCT